MKNSKTTDNYEIFSLENSQIAIIYNQLRKCNLKNEAPTLYKKTAKEFKKTYGIDIAGAPLTFVNNDTFFSLYVRTHKWKGRTTEKAEYMPIVWAKGKFKKFERTDIKLR